MKINLFTFIYESINWGKLFSRSLIFGSFISLLYFFYAMACEIFNLSTILAFLYGSVFIAFAHCKIEQEYDEKNIV